MKTYFANAEYQARIAGGTRPPRRQNRTRSAAGSHTLAFLASLLLGLGALPGARADLSAPDNTLYGLVVLGTNAITADNPGVVVEARRGGLPVSRYRMGERAEAGNFYVLAIKAEEIAPRRDPASAMINETLAIVVVNNGIDATQRNFTITERGQVGRLDFGSLPTNTYSGFDAWAWVMGLDFGSQNLDADVDGVSNLEEYLAGTDPTDAADRFELQIGRTNTLTRVSFGALPAEGVGYEGVTRHYALEWLPNLSSSSWQAVPGYADLLGANQVVVYTAPNTNASLFVRGKVWLQPAP